MPKFNLGKLLEGSAYGVMNEILAEFRSDDGFAKPSRYEVVLLPPQGTRAKPKGALSNIFSKVMEENTGEGTTRKTGLLCESISFPGRTMDTTEDTNIFGPIRSVVTGYSYGDVAATFQCSSDMKEKLFFETWQRLSYNPQTWTMGYYDDYVGGLQIYQLDGTKILADNTKVVSVSGSTVKLSTRTSSALLNSILFFHLINHTYT